MRSGSRKDGKKKHLGLKSSNHGCKESATTFLQNLMIPELGLGEGRFSV